MLRENDMSDRGTLLKILDLARWAPSGDNTQPWRFEIVSDDHIAIHGHDTREWCVYDFEGRASYMAHGTLLETLRIAATAHRLRATWSYRAGTPDTAPIYDVRLNHDPELAPSTLIPFIETRTVQRRPMRMTPLTDTQREALRVAPGQEYTVQFSESFAERLKIAGLLWDNAYIRLTCPEAYLVHKEIIEWGVRYSKDCIPGQAVGVDPLTARLMRWVMQSWERVEFFNRYLFGTIAPRVQLDFLPAICCAAHVLIRAKKRPEILIDYVLAGCALQRLWLTASAFGLHLQPEMTPVIFRWYVQMGRNISAVPQIDRNALSLAKRFECLAGGVKEGDELAFFCRVGYSTGTRSRSLRKELRELLLMS